MESGMTHVRTFKPPKDTVDQDRSQNDQNIVSNGRMSQNANAKDTKLDWALYKPEATNMIMKDPTMMSPEVERMVDTRRLSADAAPFRPYYKTADFAIYNEGIPTLVLTSEADLSKILHGIQDEALEECFPPDAYDAAELEEVEFFVETMAHLAMLEEREEKARRNFNHIGKRWEIRRSQGLKGRPRQPKHMVDPCLHENKTHIMFSSKTTSIVPYSHHHKDKGKHDMVSRQETYMKQSPKAMMKIHRVIIQQPRKQF